MVEVAGDLEAKLKMEETVENGVNVPPVEGQKEEDFVDPWNVSTKSATGIDYDKLIGKVHMVVHVCTLVNCYLLVLYYLFSAIW